ncbi:LysE family translocator [Actinoplanes sp. NEAU-A12]|uniref:LysE family translocator n=1 Tax=Actinoplanes sandaracinus TaxID=3045177 RepID=A0ABT6WKQ5_9ACTN|nr:LysE family translocator [Actinoplanes sandaracinus]MDI6100303.1 LysE family translocator [Actinoplanes sandaracinus]
MTAGLVAGFLVAVFPMIATPGASFTLLVRHVTGGAGAPAAVPVILGTVTGLQVHATLAAAGLSAVILHAGWAFTALRIAGAAYLIGLGLWTWRAAGASGRTVERAPAQVAGRGAFLQALLGNVLNPKAALIFVTLVPQFVHPGRALWPQILTLALAQSLLVAVWLGGWAVVITRAGPARLTARFTRTMRRITAATLITLGVRTALS